MALQVHGVVKEAQDFDHLAIRSAPDAEHDEMTPFVALSGDVKREYAQGCRLAFLHRRSSAPA